MTMPPAGEWTIDPRHVSAFFRVQHLVVARVRGRFDVITGTLIVAEKPERSMLDVRIEAASINTANAARDAHLRSPAFLDVERFPELRYRATAVRPGAEPGHWTVPGHLTLRGQTRPVDLDMRYLGTYEDEGIPLVAFCAVAGFDRTDFGMTFNRPLAIGGMAIGTLINIEIEVEAVPPDVATALPSPRH